MGLIILNILFHVAHLVLIVFNLFGWIFRKTRLLNLFTLLLTFLSWFGLGLFWGVGYCPLTDWHWDIKRQMGEVEIPASYVEYFFDSILKVDVSSQFADYLTLSLFSLAFIISLFVNRKMIADWVKEMAFWLKL